MASRCGFSKAAVFGGPPDGRALLRDRAWILYAITAAMMIFIMAPLLLVMAVSVSDSYFVTFPPQGFHPEMVRQGARDRDFIDAMQLSILLALGTTAGSLLFGVPASFALVRGTSLASRRSGASCFLH